MLRALKKLLPHQAQQKFYRFVWVSLFNVVVTQALLWAFSLSLNGVVANIIAVCLAAIPAFFLYKNWVWLHTEKSKLKKEIIIFWLLALVGLAFSTFTVWLATRWSESFWSLALGNITGFGIIWVGKFILFETYLFKPKNQNTPL